jgi:arsenate reductase (thioredoxin)
MSNPRNVLFLCTANSARSILAEAILNRHGEGHFRAFSAGSQPRGIPNPDAIRFLESRGYDAAFARSKSWDEFAANGAPQMDFIITVCDNAAGEACPVWPGRPATAHWGIPDPAGVEGSEEERLAAFAEAHAKLERRIEAYLALPLDALDQTELKSRMAEIGRMVDEPA